MIDFRFLMIIGILPIAASAEYERSLPVPSPRIVGGLPADGMEFPYIVSLIIFGRHICGGSIINQRTVITAAHCLDFLTPRMLKVRVGFKGRKFQNGNLVAVKALHRHNLWTEMTMDYDVGLVRLASDLAFDATVQPIQLANRDDFVPPGSLAIVAGWGYLGRNGPEAEYLQYARVPILDQKTCKYLLMTSRISDRMLCAGYIKGGVDACTMDSGGPLVLQKKLIGIVSWGISCALPYKPGVYTRVSEVTPWIKGILAIEYNEFI